jgi:hypothetical protein
MIRVIVTVVCVVSGVLLSTITTIVHCVHKPSMATEANYWNNYFKTHYK